jgi:hypothetical protein
MNREETGEHAQRNFQFRSFFFRNRQEAGIVESGGAGRFSYGAIQRRDGRGIADASSKLAVEIAGEIKRGEDASRIRQPE